MALRIQHSHLAGVTVKVPSGEIIAQGCYAADGSVLREPYSPEFYTFSLDSDGCVVVGDLVWECMQRTGAATAWHALNPVDNAPTQRAAMVPGAAFGHTETVYLIGEDERPAGYEQRLTILDPTNKLPHDIRSN